MDYDELLVKLGEFGPYQKKVYFLVCLIGLPAAFYNLNIVFVAAEPDFWCSVPEANHLLKNLTRDEWLSLTAPKKTVDDKEVHDACKRYSFNFTDLPPESAITFLNESLPSGDTEDCTNWEYDTSQYKTSIVMDWDLVCDKEALVPTMKSLYMAGLMAGVLTFGTLSDAIGRKPALALALVLQIILGICVSFSPNYIAFAILRFLLGAANIAAFTTAFVLGVEMVGPSYRVFAGIGIEYFWAAGYVLLAGLAFLIRKWVPLQLATSCPWVLLLAILFFVPESPRWLYTQGKQDKAEKIVKKMARVNKVELPEKLNIVVKRETKKAYVWDLLRYPTLRLRTLNIWFNWFVNSLVYYGLSLNSSGLGGNDYINFLILGAVEFPAYIMCHFTLKHLGRRWPLAVCMVIGGASLLLTLPIPTDKNWIIVTLAMIGKFCISASFAIIYVFSAELFPTVVRNVGVGSGSFWARVGGVVAPYIGELDQFGRVVPLIIFGILSLVAGFLALALPETKDRNLPATLEDGENFGRYLSLFTGRNEVVAKVMFLLVSVILSTMRGRKGTKVEDKVTSAKEMEAYNNLAYNEDLTQTKF